MAKRNGKEYSEKKLPKYSAASSSMCPKEVAGRNTFYGSATIYIGTVRPTRKGYSPNIHKARITIGTPRPGLTIQRRPFRKLQRTTENRVCSITTPGELDFAGTCDKPRRRRV